MKAYVKAIIAAIGCIGTWGITAAADNSITAIEWFGLLVALSTALGVYAFPNKPSTGPADEGGHADWSIGAGVVVLVLVVLIFMKVVMQTGVLVPVLLYWY